MREGTAAEDHHRAQRRTRRRAARPVRNRARGDGRQGAGRNRQQGLRRSQIVILDALLKLRQVCCDPRLVKASAGAQGQGTRQARPADGHAARTGGRRPAHTGVLAVHQHAGADRGRTDRQRYSPTACSPATPAIAKRRSAASRPASVPIFLISLKAGGVGLNLTAADTVDPLRPVVEPGGRKPGHRPRPPHRPGQAGVRLQADRQRQHRGKDSRPAGTKSRTRRRHPVGRSRRRTSSSAPTTSPPSSSHCRGNWQRRSW